MAMFLCLIMFKVAVISELPDVMDKLSIELQQDFRVPSAVLSSTLGLTIVGVIVASAILMVGQLGRERVRVAKEMRNSSARRLRYKDTRQEVHAQPIEPDSFHLFLSHVWGTGQDQMRIVKQRLLELIPELSVFLDVDDMKVSKQLHVQRQSSAKALVRQQPALMAHF
jgi:hypothetical protein